MDQQVKNFIQQYNGQTNVGNTPENKGQCVGLVSVWMDTLGIPHEYGNAKDLIANANTAYVDVTYNNPSDTTQFPSVGSVIVFDGSFGGGDGHTGVITWANGTAFDLFEENDKIASDPTGACTVTPYHDYAGVIGWFTPKPQGTFVDTPTFDKLVTESTLYEDFLKIGYTKASDVTTKLQQLQSQITALQQEVGDLTTTSEGLVVEVQQNKIALAKQADITQQQATGDATSIDTGLDAQEKVKDLTSDLNAVAVQLHTTYPPVKNLTGSIAALQNQVHTANITVTTQAKTFQQYIHDFITMFIKK